MHIERTLRDTGGTKVRLGATEYHFKELWAEGPHVAPVEDEDHQDVFLSVPEGYREYDGPLPETLTLGAIPVLTPALTAPAPQEPAPVPTQQDAKPEQGQNDQQQAPDPGAISGDKNGDGVVDGSEAAAILAALPENELRALFESEIGRKAHHNAKPETMIAQIVAAREEAAGSKKEA